MFQPGHIKLRPDRKWRFKFSVEVSCSFAVKLFICCRCENERNVSCGLLLKTRRACPSLRRKPPDRLLAGRLPREATNSCTVEGTKLLGGWMRRYMLVLRAQPLESPEERKLGRGWRGSWPDQLCLCHAWRSQTQRDRLIINRIGFIGIFLLSDFLSLKLGLSMNYYFCLFCTSQDILLGTPAQFLLFFFFALFLFLIITKMEDITMHDLNIYTTVFFLN